ncbi:F-box/FBD/LRR-repeat protein At1g16930-like [Carex rostrata]
MVRMEKKNCWEIDGGIDRISNLPDVVLEHILSFLSTKEAVETCILSKRWNRTWARVPILDINYDEFRMCTNYEEREAKFVQFVKGVLQNRDPSNLEKFKLVWYEDTNCASFNSGVLESCIFQAMKFKPRVFFFFFLSVHTQELLRFGTDSIFTCESLHDVVVENNLKDGYLEIAPSSVHLLCLKKSYLTHITVNDDFKDKLFVGCPILEELFLRDCSLEHL